MTESHSTPKRPDRDELDPELLTLSRPRSGIGPILVLSVVGLSLYVIVSLRADLAYWFGPRTPQNLGVAAEHFRAGGSVPDNALVQVVAAPDRSAPARLTGRQDVGHRLMPVPSTSGRLWLHIEGEAATTKPGHDEAYTGRLRRLDDLAFAGELRAYLAKAPPVPRFLDVDQLPAAGATVVEDLGGDRLKVEPTTKVSVAEVVEGVAVVEVLRSDSTPDEAQARARLVEAGVTAAPGPEPSRMTATGWTYELAAPGGPAEVRARLAAAKLFGTRVEPKVLRHEGTWSQLSVDPASGGVRLGDRVVPSASVRRVAVWVPLPLSPDATVLLADDRPETYWYVPVLDGALILLSALMIWALVRSLLPDRTTPPLPAAADADAPPAS